MLFAFGFQSQIFSSSSFHNIGTIEKELWNR